MWFREIPSSSASWYCASFCWYTSSLNKSKQKIRNLFYKEVSVLLIYQHETTSWWWMVVVGNVEIIVECWVLAMFGGGKRTLKAFIALHCKCLRLTFKIWYNGKYFYWVKNLLFSFNCISCCIIHDDRRKLHAVRRGDNWEMFSYFDQTIFSIVFAFVIFLF